MFCLSWALRHPIALIYPNEDKSRWVLQMVNEDRFGQYLVIPLLFTGDLGVDGHYRLICSEWAAMNLPGVHREVPANYRRDKFISVTLDSLRPAPKAAPGDPKNVKVSSSGKPVKINVKSRIAADGDAAVIKEPVLPRAANKKADQKPPSNKRRSDGAHLERERRWYVQGKAVDPEHGQLRQETLSDEMAEIYWNRALILVAEVDKQQGGPKYQTMFEDRQTGYLAIHELRYYLVECVAGKLIQGKRAVSKAYLDTLKRAFNSLVYAFVWPKLTEEEWQRYQADFQNIRTEAGGRATEIAPKIGKKGTVWVPDPSRPSGGYFVSKAEPNLNTLLGKLALMENTVADLEYRAAVASNADKPKRAKKEKEPSDALNKVKLQLAEAKMALLAGYLAMWTCERTEMCLFCSLCLFVSFFL